jgi:hypothetical protein
MTVIATVRDALAERDPRRSIERVHTAIAKGLEELDPSVDLKRTGYFNHSWAPDFVMSWPGAEAPRHIFLRFGVRDPVVLREVELLRDGAPVFVGLPADDKAVQPSTNGDATPSLREARALVAETEAIGELGEAAAEVRDVRTATRAVVRGGVGILDSGAASRYVDSYTTAVREVLGTRNTDVLRKAMDDFDNLLDEPTVLRLESSLRTRWLAAGAAIDAFPGREAWQLGARTAAEIADLIEALLDQDEPVAPAAWLEIAAHISADAVGTELRERRERRGGRLNDFVRTALQSWSAQWAHSPPLPSESFEGVFDWVVTSFGLGIQLPNRMVFFSDDGRRYSQVPSDFPLPEIVGREDFLADEAVAGLGLVTTDEDVEITLRETATHSIRDLIGDLVLRESATWRAARISSMTLRLPALSAEATIDYRRNVIEASRPLPLRQMLTIAAKFISDLSNDELRELSRSIQSTSVQTTPSS